MTQELLSPCCGASLRTYGDNPWEGLVFCIGWDGTWGWQEWIEGDEMPVRTGVGRDGYADADSAIAAAFDALLAVA